MQIRFLFHTIILGHCFCEARERRRKHGEKQQEHNLKNWLINCQVHIFTRQCEGATYLLASIESQCLS